MKSIKQQYIDLREGRMTQQNFMRNLRMTMPQYITNVTSYNDSIKILKNKGILTESETRIEIRRNAAEELAKSLGNYDSAVVALQDEMGLSAREAEQIASEIYPDDIDLYPGNMGSEMSAPTSLEEKNLDVDQEELKKGIAVEKEHTNDAVKAEQIALDHLKEDPKYYSKLNKAGLEEISQSDIIWKIDDAIIYDDNGETAGGEVFGKDAEGNKYKAEWEGEWDDSGENIKDDTIVYSNIKKLSEIKSVKLKEAKDEKGRWTNANGKSMYDQFKEIDNLNGQEVLIGIDYEMQKNHELTKLAAAKIVIKNLKKNPIYYTAQDMSGKEGYEPEYLGGKSAQPEARQMQPVKDDNMVDKKMGMQPVKGIEKAKKDADAKKETNTLVKGVEELTLIAKTVRGVQKMEATGEKTKTIRESVDKALAKERLKEMIRQEMKEIFDGRDNMTDVAGHQLDEK